MVAKKLSETDSRAQFARDAAGIAFFDLDLKSGLGTWDDDFSQLIGMSASEPKTFDSILAHVHPDDRADFVAKRAERLAQGGNFSYEIRLLLPGGVERWVAMRGAVRCDANGRPAQIIGAGADISSRMQAQLALQHSEAMLAGILATAVDAIISIDDIGQITLFNRGAAAIFGYAANDIIGRPLDILLPERFRARHSQHIQRFAAATETARQMGERQEIFAQNKSGREFPAEASISKLQVGGRWTYTVVLRDISKRKEIEDTLRRNEARLRLTLEAGRMGAWEWDLGSNTVLLDATLRQILGVAPGSRPVPTSSFFQLVHPDDLPAFDLAIKECHATGKLLSHEARVVRSDGQTRWVAVRGMVSVNERRLPIHCAGILYDITDQKLREEELEARVAERTQALQDEIRQRERAQSTLVQAQRMDALGQLTGGIAHDSNNLLTVITGNLEMVEDELGDHPVMKYVREAQEAAQMGARLNQRLLTFSRRRKLKAQVVNLNDQVLALSEMLRRTLGETIDLTTVLAHDLWPTRVDPSEVENAILNLAINARDAMPRGGDLKVETMNVMIDDDVAEMEKGLVPGDYVRLSVSDTGAGMPPEVLRRVFEPFFTTKGPGKGTGLGLSTLYGFVKQSNGHVGIYSEVGRGTTVNVYLPRIASDDGRAAAATNGASLSRGRGESILVVEDNPQVRTLTLERLRRLGYRGHEADSGPAALALLDRGLQVDLVFSDVVMPGGMTGFDLARAIRQRFVGQKILLTSGFAEDAARAQDQSSIDLKILRKPYSLAELAQMVHETLDS